MNLSEIRDLIRAEAGIAGLDEYTTLIDSMINQELQEITAKSKYEVLRTSVTFTSVADETYEFDLPEDFQLVADVYFRESANDLPDRLLVAGIRGRTLADPEGAPRNYVIVGDKFQVYPYTRFYTDDAVILSYYKRPVLAADTDEFPIPSIEKAVQQLTMARMLRMVDTKRAQMAKAAGDESWRTSRAEHGANT